MNNLDISLTNKLDKEITSILKRFHKQRLRKQNSENISYAQFFTDKLLMIAVIREGIPYSFFHLIQDYTPFTEADWAKILDISTKSLQRYKQSARSFKPIQSEKIIEMAEVTHVGLDVFGNMEKFKLWLHTPNFSLGGEKPITLLHDSYGKELVITELISINHGIFA